MVGDTCLTVAKGWPTPPAMVITGLLADRNRWAHLSHAKGNSAEGRSARDDVWRGVCTIPALHRQDSKRPGPSLRGMEQKES